MDKQGVGAIFGATMGGKHSKVMKDYRKAVDEKHSKLYPMPTI